ncbi:MAG: 30S ribosomal protein S9 [Candidatus Omnitrophica bacterium 4484_70.2]|nr:MAG: 30S ribosomal protein S9 [Candidatus Omnitrophica bacterium 4484_70.2]
MEKKFALATGRRKEATARVKITFEGKGRILINGRTLENYFPLIEHQYQIKRPLILTQMIDKIDVKARVSGGGVTGQAGAVSLGIARALVGLDPDLRSILRKEDLLTRDPRAKERKKYGQKGARRRFQWTKR